MRNRIDLIEFPVFSDFIVHVEVTKDIDKAVKKYPSIADLTDGYDKKDADGLTIYDGGPVCFVFLQPNVSVGTVAHEAFHVVENMLECFDVAFEGETPAYHIGYIVNRIIKLLRNR